MTLSYGELKATPHTCPANSAAQKKGGVKTMPTGLLSRIDDNKVFALIGNLANADDMELVSAAKNGSTHAFEALVERHAQKILSVALRVTHSREDAEDIVQQTFQQAFTHLQKFEG